jgi:hypothetical protein
VYNQLVKQLSNINNLQFYHMIMLIVQGGFSMVAQPGGGPLLRDSPVPVH